MDRDLAGRLFLQIAEHCNREQFNALIGSYPGLVISDRWNGYSHLDPSRRQACWSHIKRDFRRHADGLAEQKTFGEHGITLTPAACSPHGAPSSTSITTATDARTRSHPIQTELRALLEQASPKSRRTRWHRQFANNLLKIWPALWTFVTADGIEPTQQPRRTLTPSTRDPPQSLTRQPKQHRRTIRRTRALCRRHMSPATPLAVHLPQRTNPRPHPQ